MAKSPAKARRPNHPVARHFHHHSKFYAGLAAAALAYLAVLNQPPVMRMLAAGDAFFAVYLILYLWAAFTSTPESTQDHARWDDDGLILIGVLTFAAVGISLSAIFLILFAHEKVGAVEITLAIASVPLGWATVHASIAVHYARLFHFDTGKGKSRGGLDFPGEDNPDLMDFLYFSFVIGMTAQTSDTAITQKPIRRLALVHGVISFFYNTVIVALSVNAAVQAAGSG